MIDPLVVAFGLGVGTLIGLTGIGGGSLMTPLLVLVIGVHPVVAVGTDLAYGAITKTVGGWRHLRSGASTWACRSGWPWARAWLIRRLAIFFFLVVAFSVLARVVFGKPREQHTVPMSGHEKAIAVAIGLALGVVLGMTSVGSGALVGLALIVVFRLTPHRVVGAFFGPALSALYPSLTTPERYEAANSLRQMLAQVAILCGPALGGYLIAQWSVGAALAFDALTFVVSFLALSLTRRQTFQAASPGNGRRRGFRQQWREIFGGLQFLKVERGMFVLVVFFSLTNGLNDVEAVLVPRLARVEWTLRG